MSNDKQMTRKIGLYHVVDELLRAGWNVGSIAQNARGANLCAISKDGKTTQPVKVRTNSHEPLDNTFGSNLERLTTPWWVFVVYTRTPAITCYVLSLAEIEKRILPDPGTRSKKPEQERQFWLSKKFYTPDGEFEMKEARNAWQRLGMPGSVS